MGTSLREKGHGYVARLISGWGSSTHDFMLYVPARYASKDYVMDLRSAYMPLMDRYTSVAIRRVDLGGDVKRLYLSADMFPHMPYRALRELEYDHKKGFISNELYEQGKQLLLSATTFGVPMPYFIYLYRNNYPGFTVPIQIDPASGGLHAFMAALLEQVEPDAQRTVRQVSKRVLLAMFRMLKHVRVVGYVPKSMLDNPELLLNLALLYATFLPLEILMREETYERILEFAFARAYVRATPNASQPVYDYYMKNVLLHAVTTFEEDPQVPGIPSYNAYGAYARAALILNLAATTAQLHKDLPGFQNPFAVTLQYLMNNRLTVKDLLYVSARDDIVRTYPDNTFSFVSALYQHFDDLVHVKEIAEGSTQLYSNSQYVTYLNSVEARIAEFLLDQAFPYYATGRQIDAVASAYSKYDELLSGVSVQKVLFESTEYVDDKLFNVLSRPSVNEI